MNFKYTLVCLLIILHAELFGQVKIVVNDGKMLTNSRKVKIELNVRNAKEMIVSSSPIYMDDVKSWKKMAYNLEWELQDTYGMQEIFFRFRLERGDITKQYNVAIMYDNIAPTVSQIIVEEGRYTNHTDIHFNMYSKEKVDFCSF